MIKHRRGISKDWKADADVTESRQCQRTWLIEYTNCKGSKYAL